VFGKEMKKKSVKRSEEEFTGLFCFWSIDHVRKREEERKIINLMRREKCRGKSLGFCCFFRVKDATGFLVSLRCL